MTRSRYVCPGHAPRRRRSEPARTRPRSGLTGGLAGLLRRLWLAWPGGIADAISYSHMRQLAAAHGDTGWHAQAFPLSVDGLEMVASLVLLVDRRAGRTSGWLPWAALTLGTAASLAANIATADNGTVSRIIAGWPAVALLIAVKLLSGILEHRPVQAVPGTVPADTTLPGNENANGNGNDETVRRQPPGTPPVPRSRSDAVADSRLPGTADLMPAAPRRAGRADPGWTAAYPRCPRRPAAPDRPSGPLLPAHTTLAGTPRSASRLDR